MKRKAFACIAALVLSGCSSGDEHAGAAATPEACAQRFVENASEWPDNPGAVVSLNYLFEASGETAAVLKNGVEGVNPDISASFGDGSDRLAKEAAGKALASDERPRLIYYAERRPILVYAPGRAFSPEEGRAHIVDMCRLREQGFVLRQSHVFVKAKGA